MNMQCPCLKLFVNKMNRTCVDPCFEWQIMILQDDDIEQASIKLKSTDDKSIIYYSARPAAYSNSKPIGF
jgi:hypothetical protein